MRSDAPQKLCHTNHQTRTHQENHPDDITNGNRNPAHNVLKLADSHD